MEAELVYVLDPRRAILRLLGENPDEYDSERASLTTPLTGREMPGEDGRSGACKDTATLARSEPDSVEAFQNEVALSELMKPDFGYEIAQSLLRHGDPEVQDLIDGDALAEPGELDDSSALDLIEALAVAIADDECPILERRLGLIWLMGMVAHESEEYSDDALDALERLELLAGLSEDSDENFIRTAWKMVQQGSDYGGIAEYIGRNPHCPTDVWMALLEDESPTNDEPPFLRVWHSLLESHRKPPEEAAAPVAARIAQASSDYDYRIRLLVAKCSWISTQELLDLLTFCVGTSGYLSSTDGIVDPILRQIYVHPELRSEAYIDLREIGTYPAPWRELIALSLRKQDDEIRSLLAQDEQAGVRAVIAADHWTSVKILSRLALDPDLLVRSQVKRNPRSTDEIRASAELFD